MKRLLMISTDRKIFEEGSAVRARQVEYAKKCDEVHIVIFQRGAGKMPGARRTPIAPNCFAYSTYSKTRFHYPFDAVKVGRSIIEDSIVSGRPLTEITCQDASVTAKAGVALKKEFKIPLEIQIHEDIGSPYYGFTFMNKIRRRMAMKFIPQADKIRVVSERIRRYLVERLQIEESKIEIRPIAVDTAFFKDAPILPDADLRKKYPQFAKIVLIASRIEREKDIPLALHAWPEVLGNEPRAGLVIVGDGSHLQKIKDEARKPGLTGSLVFEPRADAAALASYYKTADAFLNTSFFEGYGMTLVEARAAGCTSVSTDVGVAREMGAIIVEHDSRSVAHGIIKALGV